MEQALGIPMLQTEITAHAILYEIIRYQVPIYYVADAFIRAVAATDLPKDFTLHDLHWPMPGLVLGFPIQFKDQRWLWHFNLKFPPQKMSIPGTPAFQMNATISRSPR